MSSRVQITTLRPHPISPVDLEDGDILMTSVNTDSSFYRATSAFLDPLRAPGGTGKRRKIPLLAALRISASACLFATSDHHAAHGIRAVWRQRVRGLYIIATDALLRTLNCLTDLGLNLISLSKVWSMQ